MFLQSDNGFEIFNAIRHQYQKKLQMIFHLNP